VAASLWQALDETALFLEDCLGELMLRDTESLLEQHCAQVSNQQVCGQVLRMVGEICLSFFFCEVRKEAGIFRKKRAPEERASR